MNIFQEIKQEKNSLIDPINLFTELSKLMNEPINLVATAFIRLNTDRSLVNVYSYEYDVINGIKKNSYNYSEDFIKAIVNGYERVIITDEIDSYWVGFWGLSKGGEFDYNINGINAFKPFYFIREEVSEFLNIHSIPLPPCITKDVATKQIDHLDTKIPIINEDNPNQEHSNLLQRINQLEQELEKQKKNNSESVYIPPLNIADTSNLEAENNQLKIDNKKLIEQLNEAKKEIEELKNNNLNEPYKKESPKTINAQAKFIKALLHHYYGENIANNPRPHIENNDGEIKRDFETQGLSRNLPTGVVVKRWVDSIELEIDS